MTTASQRWTLRSLMPVLGVEAAVLTAMAVLYSFTRAAPAHKVSEAFANADALEALQATLGLEWELPLNRLFVQFPLVADAASVYYQLAHTGVTFGLLVWLFASRKPQYGLLRTSIALLWVAGLAVYVTYPLAPPRFALDGTVDTMAARPLLLAGQETVTDFANLYAAMPSLHVGWAMWCAIAWVYVHRGPLRHLAWLYPMVTTVVVLGTANHYLADAVVGAAFAAAAFGVTWVIYKRLVPRLGWGSAQRSS